MSTLAAYGTPMVMCGIVGLGIIYAMSRYEPPSEKRKRAYHEKELARQALQAQAHSESNENPKKQ